MPPCVRISPDIVSRHLGEEMVIVHLQTNRIYSLNRTGARLWSLLCDGHDRDGIVARLMEEFDAPEAVVGREVDALLASLREERLVQEPDAG